MVPLNITAVNLCDITLMCMYNMYNVSHRKWTTSGEIETSQLFVNSLLIIGVAVIIPDVINFQVL